MASLNGKVIAITGAAGGIGLATAHLLASRGANLVLADNRQDALDAAMTELRAHHNSTKFFSQAVNVVKTDEVARWLDEALTTFGRLGTPHPSRSIAKLCQKAAYLQFVQTEQPIWPELLVAHLVSRSKRLSQIF